MAATIIAIFLIPVTFLGGGKMSPPQGQGTACPRPRPTPSAIKEKAMRTSLSILLFLLLDPGCAVGPDYQPAGLSGAA